jgi:hypothetical protein
MSNPAKIREDRLRRMARRQGYQLVKNPRRDLRAIDYGTYKLVNPNTAAVVADFGWDHAASPSGTTWLDDVEAYLATGETAMTTTDLRHAAADYIEQAGYAPHGDSDPSPVSRARVQDANSDWLPQVDVYGALLWAAGAVTSGPAGWAYDHDAPGYETAQAAWGELNAEARARGYGRSGLPAVGVGTVPADGREFEIFEREHPDAVPALLAALRGRY